MSWLQRIRQKPQAEKIRFIWIIMIIVAVILILLWIITDRYSRHLPKETHLFQVIGQGFTDLKNNYKK
ncbi:MAG: hypothetical protein KGJ93_03690 [Patescibacteria group bacterium]|nr:hypothetical protein [Patescibacteria group bacterium]